MDGNTTELGEYKFTNIDPKLQDDELIIFDVREGMTERRIWLRYMNEVKANCANDFGGHI